MMTPQQFMPNFTFTGTWLEVLDHKTVIFLQNFGKKHPVADALHDFYES